MEVGSSTRNREMMSMVNPTPRPPPPPTTTISTIAVQSGGTKLVIALLQVSFINSSREKKCLFLRRERVGVKTRLFVCLLSYLNSSHNVHDLLTIQSKSKKKKINE